MRGVGVQSWGLEKGWVPPSSQWGGGLHVPERGRAKGLSRNLTQPPNLLSPLFREGWEKRRGWGQAAKREEGECACVDNLTRNQPVLKGRKREKQPTPGTTRQEAGIPAVPHVLCNLKLRAPGPQAPQMSDKELEQVAFGDPLGQKGPRSLERGGSSRGQDKEPQSPRGRRRRSGAVPASVRRGCSLRTATGPSLSWERGRVTEHLSPEWLSALGIQGPCGHVPAPPILASVTLTSALLGERDKRHAHISDDKTEAPCAQLRLPLSL